MYRRILDYFVGTSSGSTEGAVRATKEDETVNEIAKFTARLELLESELKVRTAERDALKEKLENTQKELQKFATHAGSTVSTGVGESNVTTCDKPSQQNDDSALQKENEDLRSALNKNDELLKDKTELCANQERQNVALASQVASLKEVVAITKDLLNIRNMEVEHLQTDMESMETKINAERSRHNDLLQKMDEAANINAKLKTEYHTQLKLFQELKEKYEQKVNVLTAQKNELKKEILSAKSAQNIAPVTHSEEVQIQKSSKEESEAVTQYGQDYTCAPLDTQVQKCSVSNSGKEEKDKMTA